MVVFDSDEVFVAVLVEGADETFVGVVAAGGDASQLGWEFSLLGAVPYWA